MTEILVAIVFVTAVVIFATIGTWLQNTWKPRREARRSGRNVCVHMDRGIRTFRPDGSDYFNRFF